jgi:hypothetical protein
VQTLIKVGARVSLTDLKQIDMSQHVKKSNEEMLEVVKQSMEEKLRD